MTAPRVDQIHRYLVVRRETSEHVGVGDVHSSFEEEIAQSEADPLASGEVLGVCGRGECEGGQRALGKRILREPFEQPRCDLSAQVVDLLGDDVRVERLLVDDLQRPSPHPQGHVTAVKLATSLDEAPQSDVCEGTSDISEHLDHGHGDATIGVHDHERSDEPGQSSIQELLMAATLRPRLDRRSRLGEIRP